MQAYRITLKPLSAFGGPLHGDTLFGQLCWTVRHHLGEAELDSLLEGYTQGRPFAVISDAFPVGHLPKPALPQHRFATVPGEDRKQVKKRRWMPLDQIDQPLAAWLGCCKRDEELIADKGTLQLSTDHPQPHNSINRLTETTGKGDFAPYSQQQTWYAQGLMLEIHLLLDEERLGGDTLKQLLEDIGHSGYGKDASIGLGKFEIEACTATPLTQVANANRCLALAPVAPQGLGFDPERSYYEPFTRFGRHGDIGVHLPHGPFKNPLLLAAAGALFAPEKMPDPPFIGQGLGGDGTLSNALQKTVHQGYAPCIGVHLEEQP